VTAYFDASGPTTPSMLMLPPTMRTNSDIARLAAEAEADVINAFTRPLNAVTYFNYPAPASLPVALQLTSVFTDLGTGAGVFLRYYTTDASLCTVPDFVTAMQRTVAAIIQWRFTQSKRDVQIRSRSGGAGIGSNETYLPYDDLPPAWTRWLKLYDTREDAWGM